MPTPTVDHPIRFFAPIAISIFVAISALYHIINKKKVLRGRLLILLLLLLIAFSMFLLRSVLYDDAADVEYLISRALMYSATIYVAITVVSCNAPAEHFYRNIFRGYLVLSLLIIFSGITGKDFFGTTKPGRVYGVRIPFYKTGGIPRSHGEFGIMASAAWSYLLVFGRNFHRAKWVLLSFMILFSVFISQSRNTYLAIALITVAYVLFRLFRRRSVMVILSFIYFILPIILDLIITLTQNMALTSAIVGEGIFEENIIVRYLTFSAAFNLIFHSRYSLLGISHTKWERFFWAYNLKNVGLHNHFLSNLVFMGTFAGTLHLLVLLVPLMSLWFRPSTKLFKKDTMLIFIASFGLIACLHFYEGFFSFIVALQMGILIANYQMKNSTKTYTAKVRLVNRR